MRWFSCSPRFLAVYEVVGVGDADVFYKVSTDGVTWPAIYETGANEVAVMVAWQGVRLGFGEITATVALHGSAAGGGTSTIGLPPKGELRQPDWTDGPTAP